MIITIDKKEYELPMDPKEVKLSSALSFLSEMRSYDEYLKKLNLQPLDVELNTLDKIEYLKLMSKGIAAYFDIDVKLLLNTRIKISDNDLNSTIEQCSILFNHLSSIISTYQPKLRDRIDCEFKHLGIIYIIPFYLIDNEEKQINKDITVGQAIEALEVKRMLNDHKQKDWKNAIYTEIVKLMAILARPKDGYEFPNEQSKINKWIEQQERIFSDINMVEGFDVAFFLTFITRN